MARLPMSPKSLAAGLPPGLRFRTKGQLATGILDEACADGLASGFACGDEVYGSCTDLREPRRTAGRPACCASLRTSSSRSPPGPG